jgi:pilus assembly protein Flp/PilA
MVRGPSPVLGGQPLYRKARHMRNLGQFLLDFVKAEDGPTAVEYAVMLALIIVVCIGAITTLGSNANTTFNTVGQAINVAGS